MKLNSRQLCETRIHAKSADIDSAGLSVTKSSTPKKSALAEAVFFNCHNYRLLLPLVSCVMPGLVLAAPEGGNVVAGSASISNPDANTTLINQTTANLAIDWQRFNIGAQEYVQFAQPDANSVALNRVVGGDPSQILGNLSANGQVFLVNPNGIYFGQGAVVDVGGIVASVHDIRNEDFMARNYVFSKTDGSPDDVGVVNDGLITARDGGYVALMGDYIHNNGIIQARLGTVVLAVGNRITMDVAGNGLISVAVEEATLSDVAGIENTGAIISAGGRVSMTARVASDLVDTAINNEGLVVANSIAEHNGVIFLAAYGGDVVNSGTLDASAEIGTDADGGGILVYSDKDISDVDGSKILAMGDGEGAGGIVRVIAEEKLDHQQGALIDVTSGDNDNADGGFVEVSGHGSLSLSGEINIGDGGNLVVDPNTLNILTGSAAPSSSNGVGSVGTGFIATQLNVGVDVTLVAFSSVIAGVGTSIVSTNPSGDLVIKIGTLATSAGTLGGGTSCVSAGFCIGGNSINFTAGTSGNIDLSSLTIDIGGGLNVAAGTLTGDVNIDNVTAGGTVTVTAGTDITSDITMQGIDAGGDVTLTAGNNINIIGNVSQAGNALNVTAGNDVTLTGGIGTLGNALTADAMIRAGNNVDVKSSIFLANNTLTLAADIDANNVGDVIIEADDSLGAFGGYKVNTQGSMSITGQNLRIAGDDGSSIGLSARTEVHADNNVTINVANDVIVQGGNDGSFGTLNDGFDASAVLSAGNDINITAQNLRVLGGNGTLHEPFSSSSIVGNFNAEVNAAHDVILNLSGDLVVNAGFANADVSFTTNNANGQTRMASLSADASITAGNEVRIDAVGGNLSVAGGTANANANANLGCGSVCAGTVGGPNAFAVANADALITGALVTINNVTGNIDITGGNADANATATSPSAPFLSLADGQAQAAAAIDGGNVTINNVGGNLTVNSGTVTTNTAGTGTRTVASRANATLHANTNLTVDVGGDIALGTGGQDALISAGAVASIVATNNINISGVVAAGNTLMVVAGNILDLNHAIGGSGQGQELNADVTLAGQNILIDNDIVLGNNTLTLAGQSGTGTISILGSSAAPLTVSTAGNLSITGNNLLVKDTTVSGATGTSASVAVSANNIDVVLTGNMDIEAGVFNPVSPGSGSNSVNASVTATGDISIVANNLNVKGGTAIASASGGVTYQVEAIAKLHADGNMNLALAGDLNITAGNADADAISATTHSANADAEVSAGSNLTITAANVNLNSGTEIIGGGSGAISASAKSKLSAGSALSVIASNNIIGTAADISAAGMYMEAANNIDLLTSTISVGNGTVDGILGDAVTLAFIEAQGVTPPTTPNPNAKFRAGGLLNLGTITMDGDVPYLWLEADSTSIEGLTLPEASDVVVQFSPFTLDADIGVEASPDETQLVNYNNLEHFSILPGTTVIIGSSEHTGKIVLGNLGSVDVGSQNFVAVTASEITSIDNVLSTGIVAELLIGQSNRFVTPVLTNIEVFFDSTDDPFDEKERKKNLVKDDEEEINMCEAG